MKFLGKSLVLLLLGGLIAISFSTKSYAGSCSSQDPFCQTCNIQSQGSASTSNSPLCSDNDGTNNPVTSSDSGEGLINKIANLIAIITGIIAVIIIIVAGLMYALSGGESQRINSAKNAIIFAAVGLVVIIVARTIIFFIIGSI